MSLRDTSKFISLILRHKPDEIGITLDEHGWANVEDLISGISKTRPFDAVMPEDGYKFYLSENGVWLTKEVPVKYISLL